jgi:hypothetical protein
MPIRPQLRAQASSYLTAAGTFSIRCLPKWEGEAAKTGIVPALRPDEIDGARRVGHSLRLTWRKTAATEMHVREIHDEDTYSNRAAWRN